MVYSLIAFRYSDSKLIHIVSYPCDSLSEFFIFLSSHPSVIPEEYYSVDYKLYYNVDDVDDVDDVDEE